MVPYERDRCGSTRKRSLCALAPVHDDELLDAGLVVALEVAHWWEFCDQASCSHCSPPGCCGSCGRSGMQGFFQNLAKTPPVDAISICL